MASGSFFVRTPEDALRHVNLLAAGLKKVALVGFAGGFGCGALAVFLSRFLVPASPQANALPGFQEMSGISFVTLFMAVALLVFSVLYLISGWGLSQKKPWARYVAAATFALKVMLCAWLGRGSVAAMVIFLGICCWGFYGLWVLLSKEAGQLLGSPAPIPAGGITRPQPGASGLTELR